MENGKILVVDDDGDVREVLRRILQDRWTVETATDGANALALIARGHPDLVLSDIRMPGMDGLELLRRIRAAPDTAHLPVILMSVQSGHDRRIEGFDAGADDFIAKPFDHRELTARIATLLKLTRERNRAFAARAAAEERAARTAAELAQKEALLREIHHRVKNNLQMLQSMIRLTARRAPVEAQPYFMDVLRRIWAVSQVHNLIYAAPDVTRVALDAYLSAVCAHVAGGFPRHAGRIELSSDIAPVALEVDAAIPLGLIVVELLTNVYRHAYPDGRAGRVRVVLRAEDGTGRLTIADDGIGFADGGVASFGLSVVKGLVQQIGGEMDIATGPGAQPGAQFVVRFPLAGTAPSRRFG